MENTTINFDEIEIIKELGLGVNGTTYLVKYKNKEYVLKVQHILEEYLKIDYSKQLWRELDTFSYIDTLKKEDQFFFAKLYGYSIYDKCTHIQKRNFKKINESMKKIDQSEWCVKFLMDFKGSTTLNDFLKTKKLSRGQIFSIMIQICKIIYLLYEGGYSHNDLHLSNIMITSTNDKTFNFMDKIIPYNGYQISAIDYGLILNIKYKINYKEEKYFLLNREGWMFNEMFYTNFMLLNQINRSIDDCIKSYKKIPSLTVHYEGIKKIIENHPDFFKSTKSKYTRIFPNNKKSLNKAIEEVKNYPYLMAYFLNKNNEDDSRHILKHIIFEFQLLFPDEYSKYFKFCSVYRNLLPINIVKDLLLINNYNDYINFLIDKIKKVII